LLAEDFFESQEVFVVAFGNWDVEDYWTMDIADVSVECAGE